MWKYIEIIICHISEVILFVDIVSTKHYCRYLVLIQNTFKSPNYRNLFCLIISHSSSACMLFLLPSSASPLLDIIFHAWTISLWSVVMYHWAKPRPSWRWGRVIKVNIFLLAVNTISSWLWLFTQVMTTLCSPGNYPSSCMQALSTNLTDLGAFKSLPLYLYFYKTPCCTESHPIHILLKDPKRIL